MYPEGPGEQQEIRVAGVARRSFVPLDGSPLDAHLFG